MNVQETTLQEALLIDLSRRIAAQIQAHPFQCATNAWRAFIHFPELFQSGGRLVEGWYVIEEAHRVTINEHMWCERANGQIIDPSVLLLVSADTPVYYFPGLARSWAETEALEGQLFPHVRFDGTHGPDGLGHTGYKAAREAARRKVYALAQQSQPPKAMQFLTAQDLHHLLSAKETPMMPVIEGDLLDLACSLRVACALPAMLGRCWYNAREALLRLPAELFLACYVEGWLVSLEHDAIRICEHGWLWHPHRGVIDPTLVLQEEVPTILAYFPGVRLSWAQLQQYAANPLPLARHLPHLADLDYRDACHQAQVRAEALAWHTGAPVRAEPGMITTVRSVGPLLLSIEQTSWDFPVPAKPSARIASLLQQEGKHL